MIKYTLFSAVVMLLCAGTVAGSPADVLGVIGMDPVGAASCVAVYVPLAEGQALAGIDWYNNDGTAAFPVAAVSGGASDGPGDFAAAVTVAEDLYGLSSAWSRLLWDGDYRSDAGGVYVLFRLPAGSVYVGDGAGGGAAVGYQDVGSGLAGWLSLEGEAWVALQAAYGMAFRPIVTDEGPETVVLTMATKSLGGSDGEEKAPPALVTAFGVPHPNPFNPSTKLKFTLAKQEVVELDIYNLRGERVARLADGVFSAGEHMVPWHGRSDRGRELGSGVYLARLTAGGFVQTHRLMLVK